MYLQYYALVFFLFYFIDKKNWYTWLLLSLMCSLLKCNTVMYGVLLDERYTIRCTIILVSALMLMKEYTLTSGYQSFILLLFLAVNPLMLYDTSNNNYFYANYEAIIYGLVSCQFIAIVPRIWRCARAYHSSCISSNKNKRLVDRV